VRRETRGRIVIGWEKEEWDFTTPYPKCPNMSVFHFNLRLFLYDQFHLQSNSPSGLEVIIYLSVNKIHLHNLYTILYNNIIQKY